MNKSFCPLIDNRCKGKECVFWTTEYEECLLLELVVERLKEVES